MKIGTKLLYIGLWITTLIAVVVLFALPSQINADILTTGFTSWQHQGIYLSNTYELDDIILQPKDRIIRINDCPIDALLSNECETNQPPDGYRYDLIRSGQLITFESQNRITLLEILEAKPFAFIGVISMLLCALLTIINVEKVRWYPHILLIFLLFSVVFSFHVVRLPIRLITFPVFFWFYFAFYLLAETTIRAVLLNLILVYPQQRFNKKRTRHIILGTALTLPPLILTGLFFSAPDKIVGIFRINQWLAYYSYLFFVIIGLTILYHLRKAKRPMVSLRIRWMRIGAIATVLLLMLLGVLLFTTAESILDYSTLLLNNPTETIFQPYTLMLLVVFGPIFYAIPLGERYPRKIDNIENRILFYLLLGAVLFFIYTIGFLLLFRFNLRAMIQQPYVLIGYGLSLAVMLVLALLRSPINRVINRWFYRDRLRYQTLLPGFVLELSSNLNYSELIQLLLKKLPEKFEITSTVLMLRQPGGESYELITDDSEELPAQFSRNHPIIHHFQTTRKPILRYLDQKLLHPGMIALMEKLELEAAIPLVHLGSLVGIYFLQIKENGKPYTISELNVLSELDEWAGTAVYNTWVVSEKEDYSRTLELEMEQQSKELDRVVDETRKFQRTNQERSQQRETVLGQVHQDLREPLNVITSVTTLMSQNEETIDRKHLDVLSSKANLLAQRLNIFLDYSALQTKKFQPNTSPCNLSELFDDVISDLTKEVPNIGEAISFHIEANTPMLVMLDIFRVRQILTHLIQITLTTYPNQAFVITCSIESTEFEVLENPRRLSFLCKSHPEAILLHKLTLAADQHLLKMDFIQQLLRRLNGELMRAPTMSDKDFPFHFVIQTPIPDDSFPAYLAIDLPFLKNKNLVIIDTDPYAQKQMVLHATSWGMNVTAITDLKVLPEVSSIHPKPDLIMINGNSELEEISPLDGSIRTIIYQINQEEGNKDAHGLPASTMYNLITRALLFSITSEQYPYFPRNLNLSSSSITEGKLVTVVGESDNRNNLVLYLSRFNLHTSMYEGSFKDLPLHLSDQETDILILELASKDLEELDLIAEITKQVEQAPFIIATSANPIRFPALDVLQAGADKYLLKPYNLEELLTMIAEWLNIKSSTESE